MNRKIRLGRAAAVLLLLTAACQRNPGARRRLTVAIPAYPASLAPNHVNEEYSLSVQKNIYESLTNFDPGLGLAPALASSWTTPDDHTWLFTIRQGVRLHDGRVLDAAAVAESLRRTREDSATSPPLWNVADVRARDARTLVITTQSPFPGLAERLAWLQICLPARRPEDPPIGTGPYVLRRADARRGVIELGAFGRYRGGPPAIDRMDFQVIPDADGRVAALRRGEADLAMDVPFQSLGPLRAERRFATAIRPGVRVLLLSVNGKEGSRNPLADRRVRQAVALAVDRDEIVRSPLGGFASPASQIVAPGVYGYSARARMPGRDIGRARALLSEAGFGRGLRVHLDFVPGKYPASREVAEALRRQLRGAGIDAALRPGAFPEFLQRMKSGDFDLALFGWMTLTDAATSHNYLLHTPSARSGSSNFFGYSNPGVDRDIDAALLEASPEKRQALLDSVLATLAEDVPVVPLYTQWDLYAFDRDLHFSPRLDRFLMGAEMRWTTAP